MPIVKRSDVISGINAKEILTGLINGVFLTFEDEEQKKNFFEIGSLYEVLAVVLKHYVGQIGLKLEMICPSLPCDCWNYRCVPQCSSKGRNKTKTKALHTILTVEPRKQQSFF